MKIQNLIGYFQAPSLIRLAFLLHPRRDYIIYKDLHLTRQQVKYQIDCLAAGLQSLGINKGDRVATLLPSCPEAIYALYLPLFIGTVNVPLHPLLGEMELAHILRDCGAKAVLTLPSWLGRNYLDILARLLPGLPDLQYVICKDLPSSASTGSPSTDSGGGAADLAPSAELVEVSPSTSLATVRTSFLDMDAVLARDRKPELPRIKDEEIIRIFYTSGTSGLPKGVAFAMGWSRGLMTRAIRARLQGEVMRSLLLPLPPYQLAGMLSVTTTLIGGGNLILIDRFNPHLILQSIARERVTWMVGSPTLYRLLLKTPGLERYDLSSLKLLTLTTEPCPADLARQLHERFGRPLENIYGMTETGIISMTAVGDSWERVAETVGRPYPGVQVRIVDENRQPLPCGAVGEIALLTAQRMVGYYRDPVATAEVFDEQGWFYTGDIGFLGEDGYLRLMDRKKELVIRAGQNIWPAEVESCLMQHPDVRRAAVLGVPHAISGETLWAFIERQPGSALTVAEIKEHCYLHLAPFKIPEEIRFVDQLPLTVTNKVQKFKLRQMTLARREA